VGECFERDESERFFVKLAGEKIYVDMKK